ncbi:hypothetical protein C8R46DRAFT_1040620 [Mycena filopes]|nr:hypothetical protein C8R46DRAFT_1040620 [Mycena filopes]
MDPSRSAYERSGRDSNKPLLFRIPATRAQRTFVWLSISVEPGCSVISAEVRQLAAVSLSQLLVIVSREPSLHRSFPRVTSLPLHRSLLVALLSLPTFILPSSSNITLGFLREVPLHRFLLVALLSLPTFILPSSSNITLGFLREVVLRLKHQFGVRRMPEPNAAFAFGVREKVQVGKAANGRWLMSATSAFPYLDITWYDVVGCSWMGSTSPESSGSSGGSSAKRNSKSSITQGGGMIKFSDIQSESFFTQDPDPPSPLPVGNCRFGPQDRAFSQFFFAQCSPYSDEGKSERITLPLIDSKIMGNWLLSSKSGNNSFYCQVAVVAYPPSVENDRHLTKKLGRQDSEGCKYSRSPVLCYVPGGSSASVETHRLRGHNQAASRASDSDTPMRSTLPVAVRYDPKDPTCASTRSWNAATRAGSASSREDASLRTSGARVLLPRLESLP